MRTLTERLSQAFTKLQLSFALRRVTIGKPLLADIIDCRKNFLKLADSLCDLIDESGFGSGPLMFRCSCSCHDCGKKSSRGDTA